MATDDPTLTRIEVLLDRDLDATGLRRAELLLEDAIGLIRGFHPRFAAASDLPTGVLNVAAGMVARVMATPVERTGIESGSETVGPFSSTVRFSPSSSSGQVWLSGSDKVTLRGLTGASSTSVGVVSERSR